jgi:hypothetical protein
MSVKINKYFTSCLNCKTEATNIVCCVITALITFHGPLKEYSPAPTLHLSNLDIIKQMHSKLHTVINTVLLLELLRTQYCLMKF